MQRQSLTLRRLEALQVQPFSKTPHGSCTTLEFTCLYEIRAGKWITVLNERANKGLALLVVNKGKDQSLNCSVVAFHGRCLSGSAHYKCSCYSKCNICWCAWSLGPRLMCLLIHAALHGWNWILRVAESLFISFVNYSTFWRPHQQALLLRHCEETSPPSPPHSPSLIPPHTPLQIAGVYVPGCPVNFLPTVHRYADISGINLLHTIVVPMQMYTRCLSVIAYVWFRDCLSGCWFTQEIAPSVSVDNTDKGRTDILGQVEAKLCHWGRSGGQQISHCRAPNTVAAALLVVLLGDRVNSLNHACGLEKLHRMNDATQCNPLAFRYQVAVSSFMFASSSGGIYSGEKAASVAFLLFAGWLLRRNLLLLLAWITPHNQRAADSLKGVPPVQVVPAHVMHTNRGE